MATLMQDTTREQRATGPRVEAVGRELARYGLVVVVGWIGLVSRELALEVAIAAGRFL